MLGLWGMQSSPSLPLLPGLIWAGVVAPDRVLSMGQIELKCVLMLNGITRNRTVLTFNQFKSTALKKHSYPKAKFRKILTKNTANIRKTK